MIFAAVRRLSTPLQTALHKALQASLAEYQPPLEVNEFLRDKGYSLVDSHSGGALSLQRTVGRKKVELRMYLPENYEQIRFDVQITTQDLNKTACFSCIAAEKEFSISGMSVKTQEDTEEPPSFDFATMDDEFKAAAVSYLQSLGVDSEFLDILPVVIGDKHNRTYIDFLTSLKDVIS